MWKTHKKTLLITSLVILLPIVFGLLRWDCLPELVPSHWGLNGEVDGWSSRTQAVFLFPLLLLGVHWFCVLMTAIDPKNRDQSHKPITLVLWICPLMSLLLGGVTYASALGHALNVNMIVLPAMGVLFIVIGNYMPKCKPNYTIGYKLPWTLNSAENWVATHRVAGRVMILAGMLFVVAGFAPDDKVFLATLVLVLVIAMSPAAYSYWYYRTHESKAEETEQE